MRRRIPLLAWSMILLLLATAGCSNNHSEANTIRIKQGQVHYQMGIDALRQKNLPIAFRELMKAQAFQPNNADITAAMALAWRYRGNLKKANMLYLQALRIKPTPAMHNNYGRLLMQLKDFPGAEKSFRLALDDPSYPRQDIAFISLGDALMAQQHYDQAIDAYRQASLMNPKLSLATLRQAKAFAISGRMPYAEALLLTALRAQPGNRIFLEAVLPLLQEHHAKMNALALIHSYAKSTNADDQWVTRQKSQVAAWKP
ncbi:MAG: tetratricopeptide repeat protein [Mariprofundales bacterium]|nr:tetratricopeptide repeat protein [Mariprofundales bacterium]